MVRTNPGEQIDLGIVRELQYVDTYSIDPECACLDPVDAAPLSEVERLQVVPCDA